MPFNLRLHTLSVFCATSLCGMLSLSAATPDLPTHSAHLENVLGTSLELRIQSPSIEQSTQVERIILDEIDRLSSILNTWSPDSELSRAMAKAPEKVLISAELASFLALCEQWQKSTSQAFNPRIASLTKAWATAEKSQTVPASATLEKLLTSLSKPAWVLDTTKREVAFLPGASLTFDAIAKGWIIDQAGKNTLTKHPEIASLLINIGGDLRQWGAAGRTVSIPDPKNPAINGPAMAHAEIYQQAMATSGGYYRGWDIQGTLYSHILNPLTGQPVKEITSASVIAPDAATADVLATVFSVLPVEQSLAMVSNMNGVHCLISDLKGKVFRSPGWPDYVPASAMLVQAPAAGVSTDNAATAAQEMQIDFEVNNPGSRKYHRPYVAVWIEDKEEFPVRTLVLWIQQGKDGLKYLRDLKRWHRMDRVRQQIDSENLVNTISSATRRPGQYNVIWDGTDNTGLPLEPGTYYLCIEAAREEGTHQIIRHEINWGGEPYIDLIEGNIEISNAAVDLRPKL